MRLNLTKDNPRPRHTRKPRKLDHASIFISYRRSDSADITGRIYDRLIAVYGSNKIFKDVDSIRGGTDFRHTILNAVTKSSAMIVIIGPRWMGLTPGKSLFENPQDMVRIEVDYALDCNIAIIPVLVQGAALPLESSLPSSLRPLVYRHALSIRGDPDFHQDVDRLLRHLA